MSGVSGGGNLSTDSPVRRQKRFQSALRKFQRFTWSLWAGTLNLGGVMREGRCCDRRNFPRTRLCGSRLSWPKLANSGVFKVGGLEARLKRGPLLWRHHTQPTVIGTLIKSKIRPPKDTLLRQWHDWHSRRRKCKRAFMIHNFEITESWEDKAGNT